MADIVELIAKLELQVGSSEGLERQLAAMQQQARVIDELSKKREKLNQIVANDPASDEAQKAAPKIDALTKAIDRQTESLNKRVKTSGILNKAVTDELGKIQQLTQYIAQATKEQATLTDTKQIKEYEENIRAAKAELKALVEPYKELNRVGVLEGLENKIKILGNTLKKVGREDIPIIQEELRKAKQEYEDLLNTKPEGEEGGGIGDSILKIFGISSAEGGISKVLQGALSGIGIGVGFSILPALIGSFTSYVKTIFDAEEETRNLIAANDALAQSFNNVQTQLQEINNISQGSIYDQFLPKDPEAAKALLDQTEEGIKRRLALLDAEGTVDGEIFIARKKRLEQEQLLLREQNRELQKQQDILNNILSTIEGASSAGSAFGEVDIINKIKALGDPFRGGKSEKLQQVENIQEQIKSSLLPLKIQQELNLALEKAAEDNANINEVLSQSAKKLQSARFDLKQQLLTNVEQQSNLDIAFQAQQVEQLRQLDIKLKADLKAGNEKYEQDRLSLRETTQSVIDKQINKERDARLKDLDIELKEERKKYELDANGRIKAVEVIEKDGTTRLIDVEKEYVQKRAQITRDAELKRSEATRKYRLQEYKEQVALNDQLLATELNTLQQQLDLVAATELSGRVDALNNIADKELQIQQAKNSASYTEQVRALEKQIAEQEAAGETQTEDYQRTLDTLYRLLLDYNTKEEEARISAQNKRIANIQKGYADVIAEVRKGTNDLNAAIARQNADELLDISQSGGGGFFGRDFARRQQALRNRRVQAQSDISQSKKELDAANAELQRANDELANATPETRTAAQAAVREATTNINTIQAKISSAEAEVNNTSREILKNTVNAYTDAYMQIANAAKQGYDMIAQYRQQDLNREIAARQQRVTVALELAKMGNTQALDIERNALREAQKERRQAALQQQAINAALQFSYAAVAIAKAAAEGGGIFSVATVSATVAAILAGYSAVRSATQANQTEGFKDGVVDYQGKGTTKSDSNLVRISRGESVMTAEATAANKGVLKMMNAGVPLRNIIPTYLQTGGNMNELKRSVDGVREEIRDSKINVSQNVDSNGVAQIVTRYRRLEHRKWA